LKDFQKILLVEYARFLLQKTKEKKEWNEMNCLVRTGLTVMLIFALLWCLGVGFCVVFMHLNTV
jgi:heme/copper-type cytochrome/quinol oxidase subunit 4